MPLAPLLRLIAALLVAAACAVAAQAQSAAPAADADPRFDILEFVVEGNTVLAVIDIERAVMPYLGEGKTIRDVEAARKALEDAYQGRGFQTVFVNIPEQKVNAGEVRLRVLEGRVERLRVTGSRYFSLGEIRAGVPALAEGSVPDFTAVQEQLAAVNRSADRQVQPVLRAGRTPGTVEVDLAVKDQRPLHGDIELNNRSSAFTSETRLVAGLRWENLWQKLHSAGLTVQASPEASDEVKVLVGNYLWRFADSGDALALYAVKSDSRVALVGSSVVLGDATIAGARWVRQLPGGASTFHSASFGIDYKRFGQTNIATATQQADVLGAIDYVPLSVAYNATFAGAGRSTVLGISVTAAPSGLLGNRDEEFRGRRLLARAGWSVLKLELSHERALAERLSLWAKFDGAWSGSPLISNEQFTLGGAESVRGYREAELAGDRGARASVELRWNPAAPAKEGAPSALAGLQLFGLLDAGAVEADSVPGTPRLRRWIGGAGAGARWSWLGWRAQVEAARALNPGGGGLNGHITDKGDWRWHLRIGHDF